MFARYFFWNLYGAGLNLQIENNVYGKGLLRSYIPLDFLIIDSRCFLLFSDLLNHCHRRLPTGFEIIIHHFFLFRRLVYHDFLLKKKKNYDITILKIMIDIFSNVRYVSISECGCCWRRKQISVDCIEQPRWEFRSANFFGCMGRRCACR